MTNTYIAPGEAEPEAMIAEVEQRLLRRLLRRRPGRPGDRRLRLRRLRGLPDRGRQGDPALPRRDPDRQLPGGAGGDRRGRQRLRDEDRDLRQGRPESAGRHRPGPRPDRGDDGGGTTRGTCSMPNVWARARGERGAVEAALAAGRRRTPRPTPPRTSGARCASTAARSRASPRRPSAASACAPGSDGRVGYAYGTDLSEAGIAAIAARAAEAARVADEDEFAGAARARRRSPALDRA